ncbi:MAG: TOBE domain-containing protein, partial [Solirubrobacteraceae bacterium]
VFLGSTTQIFLRLANGTPLQALVRNDGVALPYSQGTPVGVALAADALRVLPDPGLSVAAIHDKTLGDQSSEPAAAPAD